MVLRTKLAAVSLAALMPVFVTAFGPGAAKPEIMYRQLVGYVPSASFGPTCGPQGCVKVVGDRCRYRYDFAAQRYVKTCWGRRHCVADGNHATRLCPREGVRPADKTPGLPSISLNRDRLRAGYPASKALKSASPTDTITSASPHSPAAGSPVWRDVTAPA